MPAPGNQIFRSKVTVQGSRFPRGDRAHTGFEATDEERADVRICGKRLSACPYRACNAPRKYRGLSRSGTAGTRRRTRKPKAREAMHFGRSRIKRKGYSYSPQT